jgi:hypothetical protein
MGCLVLVSASLPNTTDLEAYSNPFHYLILISISPYLFRTHDIELT